MIARLKGEVWEALPGRVVVGAGGVGYLVQLPLSTYDQMNPLEGDLIDLRIYQHVRENSLTLYGFARDEEKDVFMLLIDRVSGIGPATALAVLGGLPVEGFKQAVIQGDAAGISGVKGIGKKTAERIILELKDKVGVVETWDSDPNRTDSARDAEMGLMALGFKQAEARRAVDRVLKEQPGADSAELIRLGLRG
ncbi:MAG TPA: Holliday junction branch migration protein RuvA [Verrucomicrobiales bacterium]|nr:Holliday junction branch migration protein RuvA [bacterium]RZN88922.1 MAG: Holliday junction branch migration protein RuvA [Verrucomicrobiaceae bacterium]HAE20374.1 Holliday junction branch migration protein RuvA [Verrucomicrobiales bacterium]HAN82582.1 Holliday junction branch migration protein RuvA [Verrucomicrobiales bacterium]HBF16923.1 Holliday junction branch migration protein RuvA [Verrucomicrobiales bacterium]